MRRHHHLLQLLLVHSGWHGSTSSKSLHWGECPAHLGVRTSILGPGLPRSVHLLLEALRGGVAGGVIGKRHFLLVDEAFLLVLFWRHLYFKNIVNYYTIYISYYKFNNGEGEVQDARAFESSRGGTKKVGSKGRQKQGEAGCD